MEVVFSFCQETVGSDWCFLFLLLIRSSPTISHTNLCWLSQCSLNSFLHCFQTPEPDGGKNSTATVVFSNDFLFWLPACSSHMHFCLLFLWLSFFRMFLSFTCRLGCYFFTAGCLLFTSHCWWTCSLLVPFHLWFFSTLSNKWYNTIFMFKKDLC